MIENMIEDEIRKIVRAELHDQRAKERTGVDGHRIILKDGEGRTIVTWPVSEETKGVYLATVDGRVGPPVAKVARQMAGTV